MTLRSSFVGLFLLLPLFLLYPLFPFPHASVHAEVVINEIFPKTDDATREWIELYNNGTESVSLDRWKLENATGDTKTYIFNASSIVPAHSFLTLYQTQTGISLNKNGDIVHLTDENNNRKDSQGYEGILGFNMAVGRSSDGSGSWVICTEQTPNKPNTCPAPTITHTPLPTSIPTTTSTPPPTQTPTIPPTPTLAAFATIAPTSPATDGTSSSELQEKQRRFLMLAGVLVGIIVVLAAGAGIRGKLLDHS